MRRTMIHVYSVLAATAMAGGAVSLLAQPAHAQPARARNGFTSVTIQPTELLGVGAGGAPRPELCNTEAGECLVGFIGYDRLSGAIDGTQVNAGSLSLNFLTGQGWATSLAHFTGTVRGCPGPGTATIHYYVKMGAQPGKNIGTFTVVEGSGTGGLSGLSGGGSVTATPDNATGIVTAEGISRLRCGDRDGR